MVSIVYLVAGMSSRFNGKLKQMAIVGPCGETLLEYSLKQALKCPFNKVIFVTNPLTEHIFKEKFGNFYKTELSNVPIEYIKQEYDQNIRDRPWGTTDAICSLTKYINEPFLMVNSDDLYGSETFMEGYVMLTKTNSNIIGGIKMNRSLPEKDEANRGVITLDDNNNVLNIKEMLGISKQKNPELLESYASVNFIGLIPNTLAHLNDILVEFKDKHKNDRKIECLLPDSLGILLCNNKIRMKFFEIKNDIIGITYPQDELIIKDILKK